ncbi:hypothetical protein SK803_14355 [Lentzea sp. BCCO 10_0856]|uniref:Uncharacterized protein n=1 Tax=Lentzea miocenica TaxID=3095431 RepID=A0ABU4SZS1_9PSEU|nr:hypothetical protein [Lentzea sp. BCCO 10_0856]MDX8031406.1 hypothetical protein [Lentzea sp. BCCO 10_0856]
MAVGFTSHLWQTPDFDDTFVLDLKPSDDVLSAAAAWNSDRRSGRGPDRPVIGQVTSPRR